MHQESISLVQTEQKHIRSKPLVDFGRLPTYVLTSITFCAHREVCCGDCPQLVHLVNELVRDSRSLLSAQGEVTRIVLPEGICSGQATK